MPARQTLLVVVAVTAVSFAAIFIRLAEAPSLSIAFYRTALASAMFAPLALLRRREELRRLSGRQLRIALASGLLLALHFATWIASLSLTSVAASVVLVTSSPIFVAAAGRILFGERVTRATMTGIFVGLIGTVIVSGGDFRLSPRAAAGDLLAIAGAATAAGYLIAGRRLRQEVSLLTYVALVYSACAVLLLAAVVVTGAALSGFNARTWVMFVLLAVVAQGIGHTLFNYLLKEVEATFVAISVMAEPIGSTLLALLFFREIPPWTAVVGGVLILAAIYVATVARGRGKRGQLEDVPVPLE